MQDTLENISLKHDNGEDMRFRGSLSSECSWYDEEHGVLCRQKLYVTENKDQIYIKLENKIVDGVEIDGI